MNDWIEAICDADFRRVLGNYDFVNVSPMLLSTLEDAVNCYETKEKTAIGSYPDAVNFNQNSKPV